MLSSRSSAPPATAPRREALVQLGYVLAVTSLAALWLGVALTHLGFYAFEDDEGTFLATAQAVSRGHELYREVWFNYFSGLVALLRLTFGIGGATVTAPRACMAVLAAATMLLAACIARRAGSRLSGILAVLFLALMPGVSRLGRSVMAEVPAAAVGAFAVFALQRYLRDDRLLWLAAAGIAAGLGIWFKYPTAVLAGALVLGLWAGARARRWPLCAVARRTALLLLCTAAPVMLSVLQHDIAAQWDQIVGTFLRAGDYYTLHVDSNIGKLADYVEDNNTGLFALSLIGLAGLARRDRPQACLLGAWLILYIASELFSTPLASHHTYLFLAPMAILAALALAELPMLVRAGRRRALRRRDGAVLAATAVGLAAVLALAPETIESLVKLYRSDRDKQADLYEATAVVAANTLPGDYVVSDYPMITFRAGRSAPPGLTNTSGMRFRTEGLTEAVVRSATAQYEPAAVIFWEDKFANSAPGYIVQIQAAYVEAYRNDEEQDDGQMRLHAVYVRPDRYTTSD